MKAQNLKRPHQTTNHPNLSNPAHKVIRLYYTDLEIISNKTHLNGYGNNHKPDGKVELFS